MRIRKIANCKLQPKMKVIKTTGVMNLFEKMKCIIIAIYKEATLYF